MILSVMLTALLFVAPSQAVTDATDAQLVERADAAFQAGVKLREQGDPGRAEFRAAAACYEELRTRGIHNADLYYNLGNGYFLAGDLPQAILAYRRGLRLSPWDPALHGCLTEARETVVYPENTGFGRPALMQGQVGLPGWLNNVILVAAALLYAAACAAFTRIQMKRGCLSAVSALVAIVLTGVLLLPLAIERRRIQDETRHPLAVMATDGVLLRKGDGLAFPARYDTVVNRGVEARLLFEREGWVQIELGSGEVGWVPGAAALIDRP